MGHRNLDRLVASRLDGFNCSHNPFIVAAHIVGKPSGGNALPFGVDRAHLLGVAAWAGVTYNLAKRIIIKIINLDFRVHKVPGSSHIFPPRLTPAGFIFPATPVGNFLNFLCKTTK
jgi:hypothetical protein